MKIGEILAAARLYQASDVHLSAGSPVIFRVDGELLAYNEAPLSAGETAELAVGLGLGGLKGERDVAFEDDGGRCRVHGYLQQGTVALALRLIPACVKSIEQLGLPNMVARMAELERGLVIITGPTGSGKSTTLAALVDRINGMRAAHIVTLEDPVEYRIAGRKSLVSQREVGTDTESFASGLRAVLREDPDVIMVGEMRDGPTMELALNAAETGHLVLTTLHTGDTMGAVNRILDACAEKQSLIRSQLAGCLQGIVAQQLLPRLGGGRVAACEVLAATPALRNLIREGKVYQIPTYLQTGQQYGMQSMEVAVLRLRRDGYIK